MMKRLLTLTLILLFGLLAVPETATRAQQAVVRAVMFYSPSCGHCEYVITEVLPPLRTKYGDQLDIVGINVESDAGQAFFTAAIEMFGEEYGAVPLLVVGDQALLGSLDIPEKFPGLIDLYLSQGGVDWPAIPGLAEAIQAAETSQAASAPTTQAGQPANPGQTAAGPALEASNSLIDRLGRDPAGNALAIAVLLGMSVSAVGAAVYLQQPKMRFDLRRWEWAIPALCLVGLGVAGYLAYVETTQVEAVCGPVGDCNTVQQSPYARLFGVLPIGILGIIGYVLILLAWLVGRYAHKPLSWLAGLALLGLTGFGLLFSIYLTFLEPFVIGATCAWCLTSAVLMTVLFWLSLEPGKAAFRQLFNQKKRSSR
jgi:uncharacterized membrane protein